MAVTAEQVKAALLAEEPDYAKAAKRLGTGALRHLSAIVGSGDPLLAAKATYLACTIGGPTAGDVLNKAARSGHASVRVAAAAGAGKLATAGPAMAAADRSGATARSDAALLQLVDDADPGVRKVAMRSVPPVMSEALSARVTALRAGGTGASASARVGRKARKRQAAPAARKASGKVTRGRKTKSTASVSRKRRP